MTSLEDEKGAMRPGGFLTFDVECSMGGAWNDVSLKPIPPRLGMMGEYGNPVLGIPLICDVLERHGLRATFFVEPFNDELGYPGETEPVCRYLIERGQDVQLHVHPNHWHYGLKQQGRSFPFTDQMADLSPEEQAFLVQEGADRIEQWTGKRPIAFRAGNMGASEETLRILPQAGIWMDSSYTFPYVGGQCRLPEREPYNGAKWYGNTLEVSLSGFRQAKLPGLPGSQPLDLMGASFGECRDAVRMICGAGADAVAILHSFSLFKVRDVQYRGGRLNRVVVRRFERFCEWLGAHRRSYPTRTFAELGERVRKGYQPKAVQPCRMQNPLRAALRKFIQGLNRLYWF